MPKIKNGWGTWLTAGIAVLGAVKPLGEQLIALFENTSTHWSGGEKISLISAAGVAAALAVTKAVQAVAHIIGAAIRKEAPPSV